MRITGRVRSNGANVRAEIVHRNETIWSADSVAGDVVGAAHDVSRRVAKGDEVHFQGRAPRERELDGTAWDPLILAAW